MLRITPHLTADECLLSLEGCLVGAWVPELATCWREAATALPSGRVRVDLSDVRHVDDAGRALLIVMYRSGVRFRANGFVMPALLREISRAVDGERRS
jgi:ABC-type transporter Mla MlaB component